MISVYRIICPICRLEFAVAQWVINALHQWGAQTIFCPAGHQLLLSTLTKPAKGQGIEDAIAEIESSLKGDEGDPK
jgi:hypothetical protein